MSNSIKILMENYFAIDQVNGSPSFGMNRDVPLTVYKNNWVVKKEPERLTRVFNFDLRDRLKDFVSDVLSLEDQISHNGSLTVDHNKVAIEVFTKDLDRVTNLDKEYTALVDQLYDNCQYYEYE